jgi:hypothetical protein
MKGKNNIQSFGQFNEMNIIEKKKLTQEEKLEELNKIIKKYGIFTDKGEMKTYVDYLEYKKRNPSSSYPKLEQELNSKIKELNFLFIVKK